MPAYGKVRAPITLKNHSSMRDDFSGLLFYKKLPNKSHRICSAIGAPSPAGCTYKKSKPCKTAGLSFNF
jgi:hypothetical protein